jgi:3-oxoacyl-[acyl-carrier protein] reductase
MHKPDMQGQVAVVTGGGSGIGRCVCLQLAERGARVAVLDISTEGAARVAQEVADQGGQAVPLTVDITSNERVIETVEAIRDLWGRIDILVNSAGIYKVGTIFEISEADWDRMLSINLKGAFLVCKAVAPYMRAQGSGAIVNVASISGRTKSRFAGPHYVASKAGIIGLTMCLANQLAEHGIRVNAVAPSTADTPMIDFLSAEERAALGAQSPLGRLAKPEEVAAAIVFLASPAASFINGDTLNVNGGAFMI